MEFKPEDEDDIETDFLNECPGIFIPCDDLKELQQLIYILTDEGVLTEDTPFMLKNTPFDILEIINDPDYFEEVDFCGLTLLKGHLKQLEVPIEDML